MTYIHFVIVGLLTIQAKNPILANIPDELYIKNIQNNITEFTRLINDLHANETNRKTCIERLNLTIEVFHEGENHLIGNPKLLGIKRLGNDCSSIYINGYITSGIYPIWLKGSYKKIYVYCDMETNSTHTNKMGWITIQKRVNGEVNFDRNWDDYVRGFGDLNGDYWLGLENIYQLTNNQIYTIKYGEINFHPIKLRINLEDWDGVKAYIEYDDFYIGTSQDFYSIQHFGHHQGTALGIQPNTDSPIYNEPFSTKDKENTLYGCGSKRNTGWWYFGCRDSNLNLPYAHKKQPMTINTIYWKYWKYVNQNNTALKYVTMAIQYGNPI